MDVVTLLERLEPRLKVNDFFTVEHLQCYFRLKLQKQYRIGKERAPKKETYERYLDIAFQPSKASGLLSRS